MQLSPGVMRSCLVQSSAHGIHIYDKWMSERVVQHGVLPAGTICFALMGRPAVGAVRAQGRELPAGGMFVLRDGEEFTLQRPKGMELLSVTFQRELFEALAEARDWAPRARRLVLRPMLVTSSRTLSGLREKLRDLLHLQHASISQPMDEAVWLAAPLALFAQLFDVFHEAADARQSSGSASAGYLVAQCHAIVASSGDVPPSIDELCRRLGTSRRTLQNSFRRVAGVTPVEYLRGLRLNMVRHRLTRTHASELTVSEAATWQGFDHLSHFTECYKALFGEYPSKTPRALADRPN